MSICKICGAENHKGILNCLECGWDLNKYILSPYGLAQERKSKLKWAKDLWTKNDKNEYEIKILQQEIEALKSKFKTLRQEKREIESTLKQEIKDLNSKIETLTQEKQKIESNRYQKVDLYNERKNIDFPQLEEFLKKKKWEEADKETHYLILEIYNTHKIGYIRKKDFLDRFAPLPYLKKIDELWFEYSEEMFGFKIQWSIYKDKLSQHRFSYLNNEPEAHSFNEFEQQVGWRCKRDYPISYKEIIEQILNGKGKRGQLPILRVGEGDTHERIRIHNFLKIFGSSAYYNCQIAE